MPVLAEEKRRTSKERRWLLWIATATLLVLLMLVVRVLSIASSRPVLVRLGTHALWLGPQRGMEAQHVQVSPGWYRRIAPETPNGRWPKAAERGAVPVSQSTAGPRPATALAYFQIGPARYAILIW